MRWFGTDWGAPVCKSCVQAPMTELANLACVKCNEPIVPTDNGLLIPFIEPDEAEEIDPLVGSVTELAFHHACFMRELGLVPPLGPA